MRKSQLARELLLAIVSGLGEEALRVQPEMPQIAARTFILEASRLAPLGWLDDEFAIDVLLKIVRGLGLSVIWMSLDEVDRVIAQAFDIVKEFRRGISDTVKEEEEEDRRCEVRREQVRRAVKDGIFDANLKGDSVDVNVPSAESTPRVDS